MTYADTTYTDSLLINLCFKYRIHTEYFEPNT